MTSKLSHTPVQAAYRLRWLCHELYHGNAFSKESYWTWLEHAEKEIKELERNRDLGATESERGQS